MAQFEDPSIMVCPDGHRCENYSICEENTEDEGNFFCDCDASTMNSAFQGLYCEHEATTYCTDSTSITKNSFCTNGGTCIAKVGEDEAHLGCDCPPEYEGSHCQFVKGTAPDNWMGNPNYGRTYSNGNGGMQGAAIAAIVLVALAVVGAAAFFARRTHIRNKHAKEEVEVGGTTATDVDDRGASSLQLDADVDPDGGILQEAVAEAQHAEPTKDEMANEDSGLEEGEGEIL